MNTALTEAIAAELAAPAPHAVRALAAALAEPGRDAAVFFYGSTLRTGDLAGVQDFYRLTKRLHRRGLRGLLERLLWPEVSYHEVAFEGVTLRAKVATMRLATFRRAAEGRTSDVSIWARFAQPARLVWQADEPSGRAAVEACAAAVATAARYAAALGPQAGAPRDFWLALFRKTYAAEFRMETTDRADTLLAGDAERWDALLPLAWRAGGVAFEARDGVLRPVKRGLPGWMWPNLMGKPLNVARILKAAFTFDGAARYAAYKIERHTGVDIAVTPFRERHPFLAAPGAWLELRRRQAEARRARLSSPNS